MTYASGQIQAEKAFLFHLDAIAAKCDPKKGWKRAGNKCVRVKPQQRKKSKRELASQLLGGAAVAGGLGLITAAELAENKRRQQEFESWKKAAEDFGKNTYSNYQKEQQQRQQQQRKPPKPSAKDYKNASKILGLDEKASLADIKKQHRKMVKQYHPDVNKDPKAQEKFLEIQNAYELLSNKKRQDSYFSGSTMVDEMVNDYMRNNK